MNSVAINGQDVSYNPETHLVETRTRLRDIRTAQRQSGWLVFDVKSGGQGCYVWNEAKVLRPLWPREVKQREQKRVAQELAEQAKQAELAALPVAAREALENAVCLRKGKVRVPAEIWEKHTGLKYEGKSPYGPRLGRFMVRAGVEPSKVVGLIQRHVQGLRPW